MPHPCLKTPHKLLSNQGFTLLLSTKDQYPSLSLQNQPTTVKHGHYSHPDFLPNLTFLLLHPFSTSSSEGKVQIEKSFIITVTTNDSTNYQLTSSSWIDELKEFKKESKSIMGTMIKENNITMTTTINENFNKSLKNFKLH